MSQQATAFRPWTRVTSDARFARWARHAPIGTPIFRSLGPWASFAFNAVTRDSTGALLGLCDVYLFLANNDLPVAHTVSDASGNFRFDNPGPGPFYIVAFSGNNPVGTSSNAAYPDPKPTAARRAYTTSFPLTENPISEGTVWNDGASILGRTSVQTDGVHAFGTMVSFDGTNYTDSQALQKGTWSPNQSVQATLYNNGAISGLEAELVLRATGTGSTNTGYEIDLFFGGGNVHIVRWNGPANDFTDLTPSGISTNVSLSDGAVWYADILGTLITVKCNGNVVTTYDTSGDTLKFSSGVPGMGFWNETGSSANSTKLGFKNFTASEL
jgi:hypothetical protein